MWLGVAVALISLALLGASALAAAGVATVAGPERLVLRFVTGAALLATFGMAAIAIEWRLSLLAFYLVLVVLAAMAVRRRGLPSLPSRPELRLRTDTVTSVLLLCTAALVLVLAFASARDRLWWDGWAIWALKARVLFLDGTLTRDFLRLDGGFGFTHLDYPLAVPLAGWWIFRHAGAAAPALASFMGTVWFALLPLLLWGSLRAQVNERIAALAALGMAAFWPVAFFATGGTADVVIAVSLLGAVIELERALGRNDQHALVRCGIYLTLGALAKNEGLAIAAVTLLVGAGALLLRGERGALRFAPLALPFVALAPWFTAASLLGLRESAVAASQLGAVPERVPLFAARVAALGVSVPWLPVPLVASVGAVAAARRRPGGLTAAWLVLAAYFAVLCVIYLLTPHDLAWLLDTSLPRVLSVFVPAVMYLSVIGVARGEQPAARSAP